MGEESRQHSFRELKHRTLLDHVQNPSLISAESANQPIVGQATPAPPIPNSKPKTITVAPAIKPVIQAAGLKGKALTFTPTKERVTVLRDRVGQAYDGTWIVEVTTRDGKKFLASMKQLRD